MRELFRNRRLVAFDADKQQTMKDVELDLMQAKSGAIEIGKRLFFRYRHQGPVQLICPAVIRAADNAATMTLAFQDTRCPVPTDIQKRAQLVVLATNDEDIVTTNVARDEIAGLANVVDVTD